MYGYVRHLFEQKPLFPYYHYQFVIAFIIGNTPVPVMTPNMMIESPNPPGSTEKSRSTLQTPHDEHMEGKPDKVHVCTQISSRSIHICVNSSFGPTTDASIIKIKVLVLERAFL